MWVLLTLVTALCQAVKELILKRSLDKVPTPVAVWAYCLATSVFLFLGVLAQGVPALSREYWLALAVTGPLAALTLSYYVKGLKASDISLSVPMLAATPLFMLVTSPLLLGEFPDRAGLVGLVCIVAVLVLFRRLLLSSVVPEVAEARGVRSGRMEIGFLFVVAVATTMSVPVVGALLMFSLMIGAPGAARVVTGRPSLALALSVAMSLAIVWIAIAASYETDWPVGFFVGVLGAVFFMLARWWAAWRRPRVEATGGDARPARRRGPARATAVGTAGAGAA